MLHERLHANRFDHSRPLLKEIKALNVYQINIFRNLKLKQKTKYGINPQTFLHQFREVDNRYPTRYSQCSLYYKKRNL